MNIRAIIMLAAVPLFLLLSLVNGALLHVQEQAAMERALDDQALAAAVTVAEFVREMDDPHAAMAQPVRAKALAAALRHVADLDGLYVIEPSREALAVKPASAKWDLSALTPPASPQSSGLVEGSGDGDGWVVAVAPAGGKRFVAARLSAAPILAQMDAIDRNVLLIVLASGLYAAGLSLIVARRITRDLRRNREALAGQVEANSTDDLRIREARDLHDAVKLMEASRQAAENRDRLVQSQRARDLDAPRAIAESRAAIFAPETIRKDGIEITMRICGDVPPGSFFAHCFTEAGGAVVLGRCTADTPVDALAAGVEIRRLIERQNSAEALQRTLTTARSLYGIEVIEVHAWRQDDIADNLCSVALADARTVQRAETYCRANPRIAPGALLAGLDVMLAPNGLFAAVGPDRSANGGERGIEIGLDREDAAETADIEHFAH